MSARATAFRHGCLHCDSLPSLRFRHRDPHTVTRRRLHCDCGARLRTAGGIARQERFPEGAQLLLGARRKSRAACGGFAATADASVSFDGKQCLFAGKKHADRSLANLGTDARRSSRCERSRRERPTPCGRSICRADACMGAAHAAGISVAIRLADPMDLCASESDRGSRHVCRSPTANASAFPTDVLRGRAHSV